MRSFLFAVGFVLGLGCLHSPVRAAVVEVHPLATAVLDPDFTPVDASYVLGDGRLRPRDEAYIIQVDVSMRIRDLQPGQVGFSNTAFNGAAHGDGVVFNDDALGVPSWTPYDTMVWPCIHPGCFELPLWAINADDGLDHGDLQAIILAGVTRGFGPAQFDVRRKLGQSEDGEYAGKFYVNLPATPGASTYADITTPWGASTYDSTGFSTTAGNVAVGGRTITFEVVPEPASMTLFTFAVLPLAFCLRRRARVIAITGALAFSLAQSVDAAVVYVTPRVTGVFDPEFNYVDCRYVVGECNYDIVPRSLRPRDKPYLISVGVWMRITDLQPGQVGFSNTAFNGAALGDGAVYIDTELGINAWSPDNPNWDTCGPGPPCNVYRRWDINADSGPVWNDLQAVILAGITKGFGPPQFDIRRTLGQGPEGDHAGTFYIQLPAVAGAWTFGEITTPWGASTYDENGFSTTAGNTAIGGRTERIVIAPEPSAVALGVLLAGLTVAGIRRCGITPTR